MPVIRFENISKTYHTGKVDFPALTRVSFAVDQGEFLSIAGPSGSGKTTILNIIGCLDKPTSGTFFFDDQDAGARSGNELADTRRRHIGFIFQTFNLLPVYTVYENVEFPLLLLGMAAAARRKAVRDALAWVGLADREKSRPAQLSGGQSQRVAIARAVVKKPGLVLADEPTANLDAENSRHVLETMEHINRDLGTTFLFSTHDDKVIRYLRRKITLIDGRVAADEAKTA